jgi:hypothetical protein
LLKRSKSTTTEDTELHFLPTEKAAHFKAKRFEHLDCAVSSFRVRVLPVRATFVPSWPCNARLLSSASSVLEYRKSSNTETTELHYLPTENTARFKAKQFEHLDRAVSSVRVRVLRVRAFVWV